MDENHKKHHLPLCVSAGQPLCGDGLKGPKKSIFWTLFIVSHVAFFLFFFRWCERPPFIVLVSFGSSSSPLVRGCLDTWRSAWTCFFCGDRAYLVFGVVRGDPRQDAERQLVPWEVEGASWELVRELEEEEGSEGQEHLDWCVKDGRCPRVFGVWLFLCALSCSVTEGVGELISVLVVARSVCSRSTT